MKKKIIATLILALLLIATNTLTNYLKHLTNEAEEIRVQFDQFTIKAELITAFEDSLQNPNYRLKVLDTISSENEFEELIIQKRIEKKELLPELKKLELRKNSISSKASFWQQIASVLEVSVILSALIAIYFVTKK